MKPTAWILTSMLFASVATTGCRTPEQEAEELQQELSEERAERIEEQRERAEETFEEAAEGVAETSSAARGEGEIRQEIEGMKASNAVDEAFDDAEERPADE